MGARVVAVLGCLLATAACGGEPQQAVSGQAPSASATKPSSASSSGRSSGSTSPSAADGTMIVVGDSEFGPMLFDDTGQAIYLFDIESTSEPKCYADCATAWPPVFTTDDPVAGDGVDAGLLGTTERADGRLQVTYNDHPLYFYAHEEKREVLCHDVFLNGGDWYVVRPDGDPAPPVP